MVDLLVIGAGLTGLTVALRRARAGARVLVLEASSRLGGQLHSERVDGFVVEQGAEGFVAGSEAMRTLAREVGIEDRLVDQIEARSYGFDGQSLRALAPGEAARFLGFQVAASELGRGIRAFHDGMQELVDALERGLAGRAEVRTGVPVSAVEPTSDGVRVLLADGEERAAEVVIATPAPAAAALLAGAFGAPARALNDSSLSSSVTVSLAYAREQLGHALDATGFVIAENAQRDGLRACTFTSSKLPARAPDGHALVRLFFRPSDDDLVRCDDRAWQERAERGLAAVLPVHGAARRAWVARWSRALPVFDAGHTARVSALETVLAPTRVRLAGSAFHGSGIDAAVRSAFRATDRIG